MEYCLDENRFGIVRCAFSLFSNNEVSGDGVFFLLPFVKGIRVRVYVASRPGRGCISV